jgi:hypothetical protein
MTMRRPQRRYTPRRPAEPESDAEAERRRRRFRRLSLRLRMCFPQDGDDYKRVKREIAALDGEPPDLDGLLDLADRLRPLLPAAVRLHTLPPSLTRPGKEP